MDNKILYFYVDTALQPDCAKQEPHIEQIEDDTPAKVTKINAEKEPSQAQKYSINEKNIPVTLIVDDTDTVIERFTGETTANTILNKL